MEKTNLCDCHPDRYDSAGYTQEGQEQLLQDMETEMAEDDSWSTTAEPVIVDSSISNRQADTWC